MRESVSNYFKNMNDERVGVRASGQHNSRPQLRRRRMVVKSSNVTKYPAGLAVEGICDGTTVSGTVVRVMARRSSHPAPAAS